MTLRKNFLYYTILSVFIVFNANAGEELSIGMDAPNFKLTDQDNIESIVKETKRVLFIKEGGIFIDGSPFITINSENISTLYDYQLDVKYIDGYWKTVPKLNEKY